MAGQNAEIHHILARLTERTEQIAHDAVERDAVRAREHEQTRSHADARHAQLAQQMAQQIEELHRIAQQQQTRIGQAEAHAAEMGQRVVDLLSSTSWRITAPLRRVTSIVYRLRNAQREGRLGSAAKSRAKRLARRVGGAVLRRPGLKRAARAVLRRIPALESRLYALMLDNGGSATHLVLDDAPGELSPRAARIYRQLKQEQGKKTDAHRH